MQQDHLGSPALPRTRRSRWLRAFSVLIACAAGFVAYSFTFQRPFPFLLTVVVASIAGALLWGGWWAVLVVPAVLWVGAVAADVVNRIYASHGVLVAAPIMALDLIVVAALPAVVGAVVGTGIGRWLERRSNR